MQAKISTSETEIKALTDRLEAAERLNEQLVTRNRDLEISAHLAAQAPQAQLASTCLAAEDHMPNSLPVGLCALCAWKMRVDDGQSQFDGCVREAKPLLGRRMCMGPWLACAPKCPGRQLRRRVYACSGSETGGNMHRHAPDMTPNTLLAWLHVRHAEASPLSRVYGHSVHADRRCTMTGSHSCLLEGLTSWTSRLAQSWPHWLASRCARQQHLTCAGNLAVLPGPLVMGIDLCA